ncbi:MAG: hypothetical protein ACT4O9_05060 [Blastocatellia bacterium]
METEEEIDPNELIGLRTVGVTAGASTPEWLIQKVVQFLENLTPADPKEMALN